MRKILSLVFLLILVYLGTSAQQVNPIGGITTQNWVKFQLKVDSGFRLPQDTLISALPFSEAYKTGVKYYKGADGFWHQVIASISPSYAGASGDSLVKFTNGGSAANVAKVRDSTGHGVHHIVNPDGSWTLWGDSTAIAILPPLTFPNDSTLGIDTLHHNYNAGSILGIPITGTPANGQTLIFNSGTQNWGFGAGGGGGSSLPLVDNQVLFQNSTTATKQAGLNLNYISANTTVYDTLPNGSTLLAGTSIQNTWYQPQIHSALVYPSTNGTIDLGIGGTNEWKTVHARNFQSIGSVAISAATGDSVKSQINGINQLIVLPNGQVQLPSYTAGAFGGTPVNGLAVDASGNVITVPNTTPASGSFVPTLTNTTNIASSALLFATYQAIGSIVEVTVSGTYTPTSANAATTITTTGPTSIGTSSSIPVGNGSVVNNSGIGYVAGIVTVASSTTVSFTAVPTTNTLSTFVFKYSYSQIAVATLSANPTSFTGMAAVSGSPGTPVTDTVTFTNLGSNVVTATAPTNFEVSNNGGTSYGAAVTFSSGSPLNVRIRIKSSAPTGAVSGTLAYTCPAIASPVNVSLSGTVSAAPALAASPTTLTLTSTINLQGTPQSTTVTGSNLTANVIVPAPTGYVDSVSGSTWLTSQTLVPSGGSVAQTIYYALSSSNSTAGTVNGTSNITSTGATAVPVTLNGTVTSGGTATLFAFSRTSRPLPTITGVTVTPVTGDPSTSILTATANGITITTGSTSAWQAVSNGSGGFISSGDTTGMLLSTITDFPDSLLYRGFFSVSSPGNRLADSVNQTLAKPNFVLTGLTVGHSYTVSMAGAFNTRYTFQADVKYRAVGTATYIGPLINETGNKTVGWVTSMVSDGTGTLKIYIFTDTSPNNANSISGIKITP